MELPQNRLKAALARGERQVGLWLSLADAGVAEMAGWAGLDWCLIDGEHAPNTLQTLQAQLQALAGTPASAVLRVAANDPVRLKQALDLGVQSVMVPMVSTVEEAEAAVAACRYPPEGIRGIGGSTMRASAWGDIAGYTNRANAEICVIVQAETVEATANAEAIAAVDGVDCVFVGPADLSADMGYPGQADHPDVQSAIRRIFEATMAGGAAAGIFASDVVQARAYLDAGARFVSLGADAPLLRKAIQDRMALVRE
mgnify:FL=1